jgi:hypothetical protein
MPKKVFTVDEVLTAGDVNEYLMNQTVMTFAGTVARGSAIPTPTEGMYAHLNDTDTLEYYDGSAWVNRIPTPVSPGLEFIAAYPVGTAVPNITITNIFDATYDHYKIFMTGVSQSATFPNTRLQFNNSSSAYYGGGIQTLFSTGAVSSLWDNNISRFDRAGGNTGEMYVDVYNPFLASEATFISSSFRTNVAAGNYTGYILNPASETGFIISPATGTYTGGTVTVYGYRRI